MDTVISPTPAPAADPIPTTVLLVDDEPNILSSLRRLLRPTGYRTITAESGRAGLEILEKEHVDLVISDMRMPEMDGARFLEEVRNRWPGIVRILLTGYADISSTIAAINRGEIYRYISKPWNDHDLLLVIREALENSRLRGENERLLALTQAQNEALKDLNAGLEDKVKQRTAEIEQINSFLNLANDKLKQNFLISIKIFSGLIELRGNNVGGHSRRVADLARRLSAKLGMTSREQHDIFYAALLHDIGKIGFPDTLIAKPVSKMSSDELVLYRKHPGIGASALTALEELADVARYVRTHHERFDGLGFPDGLEGNAIPRGGRLLAVINEYDSLQGGMMSEKRMSADEARKYIEQSRGKRFDPEIVDAFSALLDTIAEESIRDKAVYYTDLCSGMVLSRDIFSKEGLLLLAADFVLDARVIRQIQEYAKREKLQITVHVHLDPPGPKS
ncbi:HD domain-containing phosphohydrolase [Propionivibrio dicarboxylicus]|uniref:Response regulator c-di-GMP phosphodiesterase, RpfG family, contains REC and HD-GYP domains n=1 Tax=Propionivibrio dicarboxylicus TaxID=83767 RepID=A0A1G8DSH7_9RHOO|nr:HD domain-containing phosphohydrolase [Propionivibrio dicarboxylicus]SDH60647.1 Response regulator c-di-GMP phosphodiesterase, RpfG family, contains REC and HD-GYP domains [Propionivibrio dicarboxylicus]